VPILPLRRDPAAAAFDAVWRGLAG
jgi:hypothetical protein